jgi:hypothetical protein
MPQPEKTFRMGQCYASVFVNKTKGKGASFRSVAVHRRYKDGDEWKNSSSFRFSDLPHVAAVVQMALNHLTPIEGETRPSAE